MSEKLNKPKITLYIPCLNEEAYIIGTLNTVTKAAAATETLVEIIVVDDGSTDNTYTCANSFMETHNSPWVTNICILRNDKPKGIGYNFLATSKMAQGEYFRMVCGDDVEPLETHEKIFSLIGTADILIPVYTSVSNRPLYRTVLSKLFCCLVNLTSGNKIGYYNGCAVIKTQHVHATSISCDGFCFQADLIVKLLKKRDSYRELYCVATNHYPSKAAFKFNNFKEAFFLFFSLLYGRFQKSL